MKNTAPFPWIMWFLSALVLVLLASCQEKEYLEEDLERFEDSITGSGRVRYAEKSRGGCELTIELGLLQPGEDYWLCLNAAFPDSPENTIIGELEFENWPKGGFYDSGMGKKEGFWNFAVITADGDGTFSGTFFLPLPPREYSVKFLVKEVHAGGDVILQEPFLQFIVKSSAIMWGRRAIPAVLLIVGVAIAYLLRGLVPRSKRKLTVSATAGGSVTTPGEGGFSYDHGSPVPVQATPATNYHFVSWTGSAVSAGKVLDSGLANTTVTMDADYTLQANFKITQQSTTPEGINGRKLHKLKWLEEALKLVKYNPGLSDKAIASTVGIHPSQLSRSKEYQEAAQRARGEGKDRLPRGHIRIDPDSGLQDVEGYCDGDDPIA